jgi:hypothetical protein
MILHSLAAEFEPLKGEAFEQFALDVERNGVREKCLTYQGKLVDGQNRQLAVEWCEKRRLARIERAENDVRAAERGGYAAALKIANQAMIDAVAVKPYVLPTEEWDGKGSLIALIASRNVARRHLTPSQVAQWYVRVTSWEDQERDALERRKKNLKRGKKKGSPDTNGMPRGRTRASLAKLSGTSESTIARAQRVKKKGVPELAAAVERGDLSAAKAAKFAKLTPQQQRKAIEQEGDKADAAVRKFDAADSFARWTARLETQLRQYQAFDPPLPELIRACKRLIALHPAALKRAMKR